MTNDKNQFKDNKARSSRRRRRLPYAIPLRLSSKTWLTVREAAIYLSVTEQAIYSLLHKGVLTKHKIGTSVRIRREEIDAILFSNVEVAEEVA